MDIRTKNKLAIIMFSTGIHLGLMYLAKGHTGHSIVILLSHTIVMLIVSLQK